MPQPTSLVMESNFDFHARERVKEVGKRRKGEHRPHRRTRTDASSHRARTPAAAMRIEFVLLVLAASAVKLVDGKPGHSIPLLTATQVSPTVPGTVPPAPAAAPANASSRSQSPR